VRADYICLFISIFIGACGQVMLKLGVNQLGQVNLNRAEIFHTIISIFTNMWVACGTVFFVSSMILWIKAISNMELSKAYPTASLSYLIVFLFSVFLFHESVSLDKVGGLVLVTAGVYLLNI